MRRILQMLKQLINTVRSTSIQKLPWPLILIILFLLSLSVLFVTYYKDIIYLSLFIFLIIYIITRNITLSFYISSFILFIILIENYSLLTKIMLFPVLLYNVIEDNLGLILIIMLAGALLNTIINNPHSSHFYIWIRRMFKTVKFRKILLIPLLSCIGGIVSSIMGISFAYSIAKSDLESRVIPVEMKKDIVRYLLVTSNLGCVLLPFSVWWLYFGRFGVSYDLLVVPTILIYLILFILINKFLSHQDKNEREVLELRPYSRMKAILYTLIPLILFILGVVIPFLIVFNLKLPLGFEIDRSKFTNYIFPSVILLITLIVFLIYIFKNIIPVISSNEEIWKIVKDIDRVKDRVDKLMVKVGKDSSSVFLSELSDRLKIPQNLRNRLLSIDLVPKRRIELLKKAISDFVEEYIQNMKKMLGTIIVLIGIFCYKDLIILPLDSKENILSDLNLITGVKPTIIDLKANFIQTIIHHTLALAIIIIAVTIFIIGYLLGSAWATFAFGYVLIKSLSLDPFVESKLLILLIVASMIINHSSKSADNVQILSTLTGWSIDEIVETVKISYYYALVSTLVISLLICILW